MYFQVFILPQWPQLLILISYFVYDHYGDVIALFRRVADIWTTIYSYVKQILRYGCRQLTTCLLFVLNGSGNTENLPPQAEQEITEVINISN